MPDVPPRARLSRDQRRRQLLDVAWRIVGQDGADALTLGTVAKQAGVTKPVVYDHFDDREGLLVALYRDFDARQTEVLDAALAAGDSKSEARAGIIADAYVDCVLAQGREMPSVLGALAGSPALEQVKRNYQRAFIAKCHALLTPDAADGPATEARFWGMVGAADALANAAANGQIEASVAKAELRETILVVIARS
ncbi:TetR/AcrR family transcriptional regulator [Sandaracinobacteroides sayramensis]|uniref:TetR/AcrR family transcriptional regulator n=1 Tax=Sandaracinobacteroides sayramensis TaxID=2913411 RepID=UPI001EDC73B6|nr:TetR/AcrR family transcriptional regulator [Sandaracinobacteroides sayramensis]